MIWWNYIKRDYELICVGMKWTDPILAPALNQMNDEDSRYRQKKTREEYRPNKYQKTLPWYAQRTVQNGSLVKTSPPHRTVQNGSVSGTVQKGCELFAFFGTFYKERFTTVSWHMSWGCVVAHAFFNIERLSWKLGLKTLKLWMKGTGSFYVTM